MLMNRQLSNLDLSSKSIWLRSKAKVLYVIGHLRIRKTILID